jgi:hypothetical protein
MFIAYLTVTLLTAALNGSAAVANLIGHEYPNLTAYFLVALGAHIRAHNYRLGAWSVYFGTAVAALTVTLTYHEVNG